MCGNVGRLLEFFELSIFLKLRIRRTDSEEAFA